MLKVKTFTTQLKIFHTRHELDELDREVNNFIASKGIRKIISVSDAATTGGSGETIGLIRSLTYEDPVAGSRQMYQDKIEAALREWGEEVEKIRAKADTLGAGARARFREQIDDLNARRDTARKEIDELKMASGEAWEDLRKGAETAIEELKRGVEGAIGKMKRR